jgi:hypothetical protein
MGERKARYQIPLDPRSAALVTLIPPVLPTCRVEPDLVQPGQSVAVSLDGFEPLHPVDLFLDTDSVGSTSSNSAGTVAFTFSIGAQVRSGIHLISLVKRGSARSATCALSVTAGAVVLVARPWLWLLARVKVPAGVLTPGAQFMLETVSHVTVPGSVSHVPLSYSFDPKVLMFVGARMKPTRVLRDRIEWGDIAVAPKSPEGRNRVFALGAPGVIFKIITCPGSGSTEIKIESRGAIGADHRTLPVVGSTQEMTVCRSSIK